MPTSQTMLFTDKSINKLAVPQHGRSTVYDMKVSELGLRIDSNGRRSFFWFKSANGRAIFRSLGEYPAIGIIEARIAARKLQNQLETWRSKQYEGPSPFEVASETVTLADALDAYCKKRLAAHSANPARAEKADRWMAEKYLGDWLARPLDAISEKDARTRHRHIGEKHGQTIANRVVQMLRRVFDWSIRKEKLFAGPNPAKGIDFFPSHSRKRFLDPAELARLKAALESESNVDLRDFVLLSLYTGARRGDVSAMAWKDLTDTEWIIPNPKGGAEATYRVKLIPQAVEVLAARRRLVDSASRFVFPGTGRTGHIREWKRGFGQLLKRAQIEDLHIHDLRRTLGSWLAGLGYNLPTIGAVLGHAPGSSATSVYARLDDSVVRKAVAAGVTAMGWKLLPKPKPTRSARLPALKQGSGS